MQNGTTNVTVKDDQGQTWVREVWDSNLEEEMAILRDLVEKYPYISMVWELGRMLLTVVERSVRSDS